MTGAAVEGADGVVHWNDWYGTSRASAGTEPGSGPVRFWYARCVVHRSASRFLVTGALAPDLPYSSVTCLECLAGPEDL